MYKLNVNNYSSAINFKGSQKTEKNVGQPYLEEEISTLARKVENTLGCDYYASQEVSIDAERALKRPSNLQESMSNLGKVVLRVFQDEENKRDRILSLDCYPTKADKMELGKIKIINNLAIGSPTDVFKRLKNKDFPQELQKLIKGAAEYMSKRSRV